jgi:phytoene dehydrogenase-like protein
MYRETWARYNGAIPCLRAHATLRLQVHPNGRARLNGDTSSTVKKETDAIVVGAGPNGLAAAVTLARAGLHVRVLEAASVIGGGASTAALTLPDFRHDVCSAVHPLAAASPFFRGLPLSEHGLDWIEPPASCAHPLDDGDCALLTRDVGITALGLGADAGRYQFFMGKLASRWEEVMAETLVPAIHLPKHPLLLARFGALSLMPARDLARFFFREEKTRALFGGIAAHASMPLEKLGSAAPGLMLNLAGHARGWPLPRGGAQSIAGALASYLHSLGGEIETNRRVEAAEDLPPARLVLWDLTPRQIARVFGSHLDPGERADFTSFQYGPGVFKVDWALGGPIPWKSPRVKESATVHLGGTLEEIAAAERMPWRGDHSETPYVLLTQPSLFDPSRAPPGKHVAWAYCHVPHGSTLDRTDAIENQVERFAPGFRDLILARSTQNTRALEERNANLIGGDIGGGALSLGQLLFRPRVKLDPYRFSVPGHFICSSSTPPGPGVHGMCGFNAAQSALRYLHKKSGK